MKSIAKKIMIACLALAITTQSQAASRSGCLHRGQSTTYTIHLEYGEHLEVDVEAGHGACDTDVRVYCPDDILVARDDSEDADASIHTIAREHGTYTIKVTMAETHYGHSGRFFMEVHTH